MKTHFCPVEKSEISYEGECNWCGEKEDVRNQTDSFVLKESLKVEGITADYVWYHSKLLTDKMQSWSTELKRITGVMESRHKEHLKIIDDLLNENRKLKAQLEEKKK